MAPVISSLKAYPDFEVRVCVTAQHREMLDQVLMLFDVRPDYDLNLMTSAQTLAGVTGRVLAGTTEVLESWKPDLVLVHGDTTTTAAASIACFYQRIPLAHVEAGLRTGNITSPWPEEFNRRVAALVARMHFAPTQVAHANLIAEGVPADWVEVTGNTVLDALLYVSNRIDEDYDLQSRLDSKFGFLDKGKRMLLVTGHRRENFGEGMHAICRGLLALSRRKDLEIVYPVHMNPNVKGPVEEHLAKQPGIHLLSPQDYLSFVYLMKRSTVILTDSGGIQEEAPTLGKPVLVMRDTTERPEAVEAGTAKLVGADTTRIEHEISRLLDNEQAYLEMSQRKNPYGDGTAAQKIGRAVKHFLAA